MGCCASGSRLTCVVRVTGEGSGSDVSVANGTGSGDSVFVGSGSGEGQGFLVGDSSR